jgi:hypothetical protein
MTDIKITRAKLIPMEGDKIVTDEKQHIEVQFNPATLRLTLSNNLKADSKGGGKNSPAAQFTGKGESSLSIELLFDTTVKWEIGNGSNNAHTVEANSDVRKLTQRIAKQYMDPQNPDPKRPKAPRRCRLQWGSFQFTGMISSYSETLDFFAPEGIPLRATLALTLKEDRYQFDMDEKASAAVRDMPKFTPGGTGVSAAQASQAAGNNPRDWRALANANNLENPRTTPESGVSVPGGNRLKGGF